ncbi:MAG: cell division protein FtsL [Eubacterium sp.]|nr:cell division protein FtsL [Eubacterium sp.]
MNRQTGTYVYGSAARNWETEPLHRRQEEIRRRERQQQRRKPQPKQKIDKVAVLLTVITFVAAMGIGIAYLHLQFKSTYLSKSVVNLQKEVVELEKENSTARMEMENSIDLNEIYKKATKEFGMKTAGKNQILTYESRKSTQVRQHGSIPVE